MSTSHRSHPPAASALVRAQYALAAHYDRLASPAYIHRFERLMVAVALAGFALHLILIWLCAWVPALSGLGRVIGFNYLSALYTPFSFILFYELLLLVLTLPESTTLSVGRQYEIISLITVRNVFKDLAEFESFNQIDIQLEPLRKVLIDLGVGVLLFLLVGVFYHVNRWRVMTRGERPPPDPALSLFIAQKKVVALGLSALFFVLLGTSLWAWGSAFVQAVATGGPGPRTLTTIFYTDIFTVLIFTDVLLLLLSLLQSNSYPLVFRNAGFVASTVLLRLSLAAAWPYSLMAAVAAVSFGLIVNTIYIYSTRVVALPSPEHRPLEAGDVGERSSD